MNDSSKKFKWGYLFIGLLLLTIGVFFIILRNSMKALSISVGIVLMTFSVFYLVTALASKKRGFQFAMKIIFSALAIGCSTVTLVYNEGAVNILISICSLFLIMDASFKLKTSSMAKRYSIGSWWLLTILSALTVAGAFFLIKYTPENIATSSIFSGIVFLIDGTANIISLIFAPILERNMKSDIYYEMYRKEFEKE